MARIFVTGSADGLGRLAAEDLLAHGHEVVLHARSVARAEAVSDLVTRGASIVTGDLSDLDETKAIAEQVNALDTMDAVIHNAGIYTGAAIMPVNVVAPFVLTALIDRPNRLVYLSSGLHRSGHTAPAQADLVGRAAGSYSDSKLYVTALAMAIARRWPEVLSNAVNPGWVPTKMGGAGAPDDLTLGHQTQTWLATSDDAAARTSGGYWHHRKRSAPHPSTVDPSFQDELIDTLTAFTGVALA